MKKYGLTNSQKVIGFASAIYPNSAVNNIGGSLLIEDDLDFDLLEKTLHLCIDRNDSLRLRFINSAQKADPVLQYFLLNPIKQYVSDEPHGNIGYEDFSGKTADEMDCRLLKWNRKPIDIFTSPLYEFTMIKAPDGRCGIFSKIDHMAADAWMSAMLCKEIIEVYYAQKKGKELPLPALPYTDYILSEAEYLASKRFQADKAFWRDLYKEGFKPVNLALGKKSETGATSQKIFRLDKTASQSINAFCAKNMVSAASLFNTALGIYLFRVSGISDVLFGNTCMLRSTLKEMRTCGPIVNNMNMRLRLDENKTFAEVTINSAESQLKMLTHMRYPCLDVMKDIYKTHKTRHIWDTLIGYQTGRIKTNENVRFKTKWYTSGSFAIPLYISITDLDDTGEYTLYYEYQIDCHTLEQVEAIHKGILAIINTGIACEDTPLKTLLSSCCV